MAKLHEIKAQITEITGLPVMDEDAGISVLVLGDRPEMVPVIAARLAAAGIAFEKAKNRTFKGAKFTIALRNVGTAFATNWEFAQ